MDKYLEKREAAIAWMRERNLYCLDTGSKGYVPVNKKPLPVVAPPVLVEDRRYGSVAYLSRFNSILGL